MLEREGRPAGAGTTAADSVPRLLCERPEPRATGQAAHAADAHSLPVPEAGSPGAGVSRSGVPGGLASGQQATAPWLCARARPAPAFSSREDTSPVGSGPTRLVQSPVLVLSTFGHVPGCWGGDCAPGR